MLHVVANVRAMRCLQMTSVNAARLGLLLRHYLAAVGGLRSACRAGPGGWVGVPTRQLALKGRELLRQACLRPCLCSLHARRARR